MSFNDVPLSGVFSRRPIYSGVALLVLCASLLSGCGDAVAVRGTVVFPDGKPLTEGQIAFEKEGYVGVGHIKKDGSFRVGGSRYEGGIEPGIYCVSIAGAVKTIGRNSEGSPITEPLIDLKYEKKETSGLVCEVKGATVYHITVDAFEKSR